MTPEARLIGIAAHAPGSGKSTAAEYLTRRGFRLVPFAAPLKEMVELFLRYLGTLEEDDITRLVYRDKNEPIPGIGVSARHLLQTLGTEWGRRCICSDVWLQCWANRTRSLLAAGISVVVDDVRFPNEADLVTALGGQMWLISRDAAAASAGQALEHASEGGLQDYADFSWVFDNNGTLSQLEQAIDFSLALL